MITGIIRYLISLTKGGFSSIDGVGTGVGILDVFEQSGILLGKNSISSFDNLWNMVAMIILLILIFPKWKYFIPNAQIVEDIKEQGDSKISKADQKNRKKLTGCLIILFVSSSFWLIRAILLLAFPSWQFPKFLYMSFFGLGIFWIIVYATSIYFTLQILKLKKYGVYGYLASLIMVIATPVILESDFFFSYGLLRIFNFYSAWSMMLITILLTSILPIWDYFE